MAMFSELQVRGSSYPLASFCELAPERTDGWSYVPLICTSTLHLFTVSCSLYTQRMIFTYFELLFQLFLSRNVKKISCFDLLFTSKSMIAS